MKPLEYSNIFVIESLRYKDELTGTSLYNRVISPRMSEKGLKNNCELINVVSKKDFFKAIDKIKDQMILNHINPIIHLEMHGSKTGFQLTNDDVITWQELQPKLIELNILCQNNLFISMATCYGGYVYNAISPRLQSPFWGFIGPFEGVDEDEVLANYTKFYDVFLTTNDFNLAEKALYEHNLPQISKFKFQNIEYVFRKAYKNYEEKYLTPQMVEHRIMLIETELKKSLEFKDWTTERIKEMTKRIIVDKNDEIRENLMERFFMWDLFPNQKS